MKIKVDLSFCQGHGRCVAVAPELFEFADGAEQPTVKSETLTEDELIKKAQRAARACPERAVILSDHGT